MAKKKWKTRTPAVEKKKPVRTAAANASSAAATKVDAMRAQLSPPTSS